MKQMNQIERIRAMEQALNEASESVSTLSEALEKYCSVRDSIKALEAYYASPVWMKDYEDDAAGKLPKDLKRGVLSEDAVYDLLADNDRVLAAIREAAADSLNGKIHGPHAETET